MDFSQYFDSYGLQARVRPVFLTLFPAVASFLSVYEPARSWGGVAATILVTFGILHFAASQVSSRGNKLQRHLFSKWGGAPTTIVLRHSDHNINPVTKERYMDRLEVLISNFRKISKEEEVLNPEMADNMYDSASGYLREHTRDAKNFPLVLKENIAYGFARNLLALKYVGLAISFLSLLLVGGFLWWKSEGQEESQFIDFLSLEHAGAMGVSLIALFCWLFLVNESWVKSRGFLYARALMASCEKVKN